MMTYQHPYVMVTMLIKIYLIEDNKNVNLIDFDKCTYDYSAHDIAYFLRRFLKQT